MSLLYSKEELEKFINYLPQLEKDELWFTSLSARNKYLTEEERAHYCLGRSEMFAREFIFDTCIDNFLYVLQILEAQLTYRKTKSKILYPDKALIVYFNINPSSGIKAYLNFQNEMNKEVSQLIHGIENKNNTDMVYNRFKKCQSILKSNFQTSTSRKIFVDVDFDTKDISILNEYCDFLASNKISYFVIETKGGFHLLMNKESIKCNIYDKIKYLDAKVKQTGKGEVILNSSAMIPLPGTLQGGFEVKIVRSVLI